VRGFTHLHDLLLGPYWPQSTELYRPVTLVSFAIDWALTGGSFAWMHAVNALLHAAAATLVALLVWRLRGGAVAAACAGAVFAVHPIHVEAVANLVGRAEILATLAVLLACHLHLSRGVAAPLRWAGIAVLYVIGLGAKEIAVSLPALLLIVDAVDDRDVRAPAWRLLQRNLGLFAVMGVALLGYLALRSHVLVGDTMGTDAAPYLLGIPASERIATAVRVWPEYLRLMLWPRDLSADWGPNAIVPVGWESPRAWLGVVVGIGLAVSVWASWRGSRWVAAAIAWFGAAVFLVSNLPFAVGVLIAERTLYLPSVALAFLLPPLVDVVARERLVVRRAAAAVFVVLLGLGAWRTWLRTPVWRSSSTVFDAMVEDHPELWWVEWKAGQLLSKAGRIDEALPWYHKALEKTKYNHYVMDMDYASLIMAMGHGPEIEPLLRHAIEQYPESPPAYVYLASLRVERGRYREALALSGEALALPHYGHLLAGEIAHRRALAYDGLGRMDSALVNRRATLADTTLRRTPYVWYHYARLLTLTGDSAGAAAALDSARSRVPPAQRPLLTLHPVPPLLSTRVLGWGRLEAAPGAAPPPPLTGAPVQGVPPLPR
jgi:tetratricopeptide (TPR) repeat protein